MKAAHGPVSQVIAVRGRAFSPLRTGATIVTALLGVSVPGAVAAQSAGAATLNVCMQGCPYSEIQPAINAAKPGDTIDVGTGTYTGGLVISVRITLSGQGPGSTIISGGGPVITVSAKTVTVSNVSVTGGNTSSSSSDGGGILNSANLTLTDDTIQHNVSGGNGGGVANEGGGSLTMHQVTVANNSAAGDGGGIANLGGTAQVTASTIEDDTATGYGGGVANEFADSDAASLTLTSDDVMGNSATDDGGGIANEGVPHANDLATLTLSSSTLSGNSAGGQGGGIAISGLGATASLSGTTVDNNTAPTDGGGIAVTLGGTLVMANGDVNQNTVPSAGGGTGGGIEVDGVPQHYSSNATISGTSINGNAAYDGGGVELGGNGIVTLKNDTLNADWASDAGGGIVTYRFSQLTMGDTSVTHNSSAGDGGGIWNDATGCGEVPACAVLTNDNVDANVAAGSGGGVMNYGTMSLDKSTSVSQNRASAGGGIDVAGGSVALNGATVTGNIPDNCVPVDC